MAGVVHISEAEAALDLPALVDRALAGEEIVVRRGKDDVVVLSPVRNAKPAMRTLGEVIDLLKRRREARGLAKVDDEFVADMEAARSIDNTPMDESKWD
jgi:antitoxin (DNA-binding transcriptional repressor) of toxin-antitoxin stability system